jgi:hypothetical protein
MQLPPTWPVALEGIPGVTSSTWKPAKTAFLQARKDGLTGVQTTSFKHTMKTYHNILDCCNFLSSQFHVCVCLVAQYIPTTPQGLQGVPAVWMVYWTWLARVTQAEIEMLAQVTKTRSHQIPSVTQMQRTLLQKRVQA